MNQSPIEIQPAQSLLLKEPKMLFEIDYPQGEFPGVLKQSGHPVFELNDPSGGPFPEVTFRKHRYRLAQVHVHSKPEHLIDGRGQHGLGKDWMEIHLVHIPKGSSLKPDSGGSVPDPKVVLGILFRKSEAPKKGVSLGFVQPGGGQKTIEPRGFFPNSTGEVENWYHYEGSLTGSPFTENVSWFLLDEAGDVSPEEYSQIQHTQQPARGLQPLNRRLVVRSFELPG